MSTDYVRDPVGVLYSRVHQTEGEPSRPETYVPRVSCVIVDVGEETVFGTRGGHVLKGCIGDSDSFDRSFPQTTFLFTLRERWNSTFIVGEPYLHKTTNLSSMSPVLMALRS